MDDEINLLEYAKVIIKRKNIIIFFVVIFMLISFVKSIRAPKMYKAEVTLLSMSSDMGGLALTISGLSLGGGGGLEEERIKAILKSRVFARFVAQENELKKIIFKDKWDTINNRWVENEPSLDQTIDALRSSIINATQNKIEAEYNDPETAALIANAYAKGLTKFLNAKAINLNLQVLDEALPAKFPYKPGVKSNVLISGFLGLFLGVFSVFVIEYWATFREKLTSFD